MKKIDLLYGTLIGFVATFIGTYLFFELFTDFHFSDGIQHMKAMGFLGKAITMGAIMNLISFFTLLKLNKDLMARGVILATILLTLITLFV